MHLIHSPCQRFTAKNAPIEGPHGFDAALLCSPCAVFYIMLHLQYLIYLPLAMKRYDFFFTKIMNLYSIEPSRSI